MMQEGKGKEGERLGMAPRLDYGLEVCPNVCDTTLNQMQHKCTTHIKKARTGP